MNDLASWKGTLSKLELLGVSAEQRQQLFSSLAAVLAVGNLTFSAWEEGGEEQIVDKPDDAAALLQVLPKSLGDALTVRHVSSGRGSSYAVPLTPQRCADARDALAKGLFSSLTRIPNPYP